MAGIKRAKQEGKFKGRVAKIDAKQIKRLKDEGLGASEIARQMNIERTSVYRLLNKKVKKVKRYKINKKTGQYKLF